ncbi:MAG: hypothetical protein WB870_03640 [Gallionellaceae bacterium]
MNPHFRNPCTHRLAIAEVTLFGTANPHLDPRRGLPIPQPGEPVVENLGGKNGLHKSDCILWDTVLQCQNVFAGLLFATRTMRLVGGILIFILVVGSSYLNKANEEVHEIEKEAMEELAKLNAKT